MKRKLLFPLLLALTATLLCAPGLAFAEEDAVLQVGASQLQDEPTAASTWEAADFTWDGTTVTGLSEAGSVKLEANPALVIPAANAEGEAVAAIGAMAFRGAPIESVEMPDTIVTMGDAAFNTCEQLTSVKLSAGLTAIPQGCFLKNVADSPALSEVVIPEGVEVLGRSSFGGTKVAKLTLPSTLKEVGREAFLNNQLTEVVLPENVETIGIGAFSIARPDLPKTITSIVLDEKLASIDNNAFRNAAVESVVLPASVTTLHKSAFNGCDPKVVLLASDPAQLVDSEDGKTFVANGSGHVVKGDLSKADITLPISGAEYTGEAIEPIPSVVFCGNNLAPEVDYTVSYSNNTMVGVANVTIDAKADGNYVGSRSLSFAISATAADVAAAAEVEAVIEQLPETVTAENMTSVADAIKAYNTLTEAQKAALGGGAIAKLIEAQEAVVAIQEQAASDAKAEQEKAKKAADQAKAEQEKAEKAVAEAQKQVEQLKADLAKAQMKDQTITVKTKSKNFKASVLKKRAKSFKIGAKANGKVTYKLVKKNKRIKFKNGKVTVKKGTKKGTYKIKVKVVAAASGDYKAAEKTFTIKVRVK